MTTASDFDPMGMGSFEEDLEALAGLVERVRGPYGDGVDVVEVGSWAGLSARAFLRALQGSPDGSDDRLFCIDTWEGGHPLPDGPGTEPDRVALDARRIGPRRAFQTFCRNMAGNLFYLVYPCVGRSRTWAEIWPFPVDLVYIDASHDYDSVREDIGLWWPHVREGGVLAGHDYSFFAGVTRAVDEAFGDKVQRAGKLVWWVRKGGG